MTSSFPVFTYNNLGYKETQPKSQSGNYIGHSVWPQYNKMRNLYGGKSGGKNKI